ncbi:MAG TPA: glycosyltransferase [Tepidisphaeraceae bacterium]|nr:glycosyltransferase [Tepidisphaeraceae bacterium]
MQTITPPLADCLTAAFECQPEVSIVMPCLNEAATLAACIGKARRSLEAMGIEGEVVVADNGSSDGSQGIAILAGARLVAVARKGYGSALQAGIAAAHGTYVIMGDADDSYDFSNLKPFVDKLRGGCELVMGNRFKGGIRPGAMPALHRYLGNPVLTAVGRLFFHSPCGDFHCGLRAFDRQAIARLDLRTMGMEYASEMVVKATLHGLRIGEVPTTLSPDGRDRPPHLRTWRDGWRHLRFLLLYSPRWLFLYPGIALMTVGAVIGGWLLAGPVRIGRATLDIDTLMYAGAAVLIGFQAVTFSLFTVVFATAEGLLPGNPRVTRWLGPLTLEAGVCVGLALIVVGLVISLAAVRFWGRKSFGNLDPGTVVRMVVPAVTTLTLGFQILLSSFFLGILQLRRR